MKFEILNEDNLIIRGKNFLPEGKGPFPAVVLLHGLAGSYMEYKNLKLLRSLAENGIAGIGFNFTHDASGVSEGEFKDFTIDTAIKDTFSILDYLKKFDFIDQEKLGLCGHSFNGKTSFVVSLLCNDIKALSIIAAGEDPYNETLRLLATTEKEWTDRGYVLLPRSWKITNNKLNSGFLQALKKYNFENILGKITIPTLVLHGDKDQVIDAVKANWDFDRLKCHKKLVLIKEGDHYFFDKIPLEVLTSEICLWFKEKLGVG